MTKKENFCQENKGKRNRRADRSRCLGGERRVKKRNSTEGQLNNREQGEEGCCKEDIRETLMIIIIHFLPIQILENILESIP